MTETTCHDFLCMSACLLSPNAHRPPACLPASPHPSLQVGAEALHYDGPLRVRIPLEVLMDPSDNNFVWDVKLPDREETKNSTTSLMSEALMSLAETQVRCGRMRSHGLVAQRDLRPP